jgi:hypothetical protein
MVLGTYSNGIDKTLSLVTRQCAGHSGIGCREHRSTVFANCPAVNPSGEQANAGSARGCNQNGSRSRLVQIHTTDPGLADLRGSRYNAQS